MANAEAFQERVLQTWGEGREIKPFYGGITGALKFTVDNQTFLKVADQETHDFDAKLIAYESRIYFVLDRLGLTANLFPRSKGLIQENGLTILGLDYLADASWGGLWDRQTIGQLDQALTQLHTISLDPASRQEINEISAGVLNLQGQSVRTMPLTEEEKAQRDQPFLKAWDNEKNGFRTGTGEIYFTGQPGLPKAILETAEETSSQPVEQLILYDLNLGNIAVTSTGIRFVDPVFARLGNPDWDRVQVGLRVLGQLGEKADESLRQLVIDGFLNNSPMLDRFTKMFVANSNTPAERASSEFLDLNIRAAKAALSVLSVTKHQ